MIISSEMKIVLHNPLYGFTYDDEIVPNTIVKEGRNVLFNTLRLFYLRTYG